VSIEPNFPKSPVSQYPSSHHQPVSSEYPTSQRRKSIFQRIHYHCLALASTQFASKAIDDESHHGAHQQWPSRQARRSRLHILNLRFPHFLSGDQRTTAGAICLLATLYISSLPSKPLTRKVEADKLNALGVETSLDFPPDFE
jgi:hypothetical protein